MSVVTRRIVGEIESAPEPTEEGVLTGVHGMIVRKILVQQVEGSFQALCTSRVFRASPSQRGWRHPSTYMFLDPDKPINKHKSNLPHWHQEGTWIFVTWRQADSLPEAAVRKITSHRAEWERDNPQPWDEEQLKERNRLFTLRFEELLDDCHGSCMLRDSEMRSIITTALHHFDGERYELGAYVAMPNHVHVLFRLLEGYPLEKTLHSWKLFSARRINKLADRTGQFWQDESYDRMIRSQAHYEWTLRYIERNPGNMPAQTYSLWVKNK